MAADLPLLASALPPDLGVSSFATGVHVSGRIYGVTFIARAHIAAIAVTEVAATADVAGTPRHYRLHIDYVGGRLSSDLQFPDFNSARMAIAQLGCGDLALSGIAQEPAAR